MRYWMITGGLFALASCGTNPAATDLETQASTEIERPLPEVSEAAWSTITPGGETACTDRSPFSFVVHEGASDKLLVYLEGGGGCWNKASCNPAGEPNAKLNLDGQKAPDAGIFDFDNDANPFADYSVVYVRYCSGDVHIGASDMIYPDTEPNEPPLEVRHRGKINVQSALDWTFANIEARASERAAASSPK